MTGNKEIVLSHSLSHSSEKCLKEVMNCVELFWKISEVTGFVYQKCGNEWKMYRLLLNKITDPFL